jgi:hypothetical protein
MSAALAPVLLLLALGSPTTGIRSPDHASCGVPAADAFELDQPGTYSAFALGTGIGVDGRRRTYPVRVVAGNGAIVVADPPFTSNVGRVDLVAGIEYRIEPPSVFDVRAPVVIRVDGGDHAYELVVVRLAGDPDAASSTAVRPAVVPADPAACATDSNVARYRILTNSVWWDTRGRQTFVVSRPMGPNAAVQR